MKGEKENKLIREHYRPLNIGSAKKQKQLENEKKEKIEELIERLS